MLASLLFMAATAAAATVEIQGETLTGNKCQYSDANQWLKVPFAQPPLGSLRFMPPLAYNGSYAGTYTTETPSCWYSSAQGSWGNASEDCLYVDVWAPPNAANLPVKVWIYGGGNVGGSVAFPEYNGCHLATDSVVVAISYRIGVWGWFAAQDWGVNGNAGTQDQLLALQWVQDNIGSFGGDPSKVVIFGQSAGALDTSILGTLPQASSLFKAGISESGGSQFLYNLSAATTVGHKFADKLNCDSLACLQSKTAAELNITVYTVSIQYLEIPGGGVEEGFGPNIDGKVIPKQPADVPVTVPWIFGSTTFEAGAFLGVSGSPTTYTPTVYNTTVRLLYGAEAVQQYPISSFSYSEYPGYTGLVTVITDEYFHCPQHRGLVHTYNAGVPVWAYQWGQASTCPPYVLIPADAVELAGAGHGSEVQFVLANVYEPFPGQNCSFTPNEVALSKQFVKLWTSMAETGTPGDAAWPAYDPATSLGYIVESGAASAVPGYINYTKCEFWDRVYANRSDVSGYT